MQAGVWSWAEWAEEAGRWRSAFGAMLFDMDGTLVDTLPLHHRAYADVLASLGLQLSYADYRRNAAAPARISIPRFLAGAGADPEHLPETAKVHAAKKARFAELMQQYRLPRLRAAAELEACRGRTPAALVTSAARAGVDLILASQGWSQAFDAVICGDDVVRGKPDPEPYLAAARALGLVPAACLVFEDAPEGVAAALAAGMRVVDVTEPVDSPDVGEAAV